MSLSQELDLDLPMQDVHHEAVLSIIHTATQLTQAGSALLREWGLTEAQFNVLFALKYATHPLTQTELARRLVITRASVTSLLDKMEEKKLVERRNVPDNRRIYHVVQTAKGRALLEEAEPRYRDRIHAVMQAMNLEEHRVLLDNLERVRKNLSGAHDERAVDRLEESKRAIA